MAADESGLSFPPERPPPQDAPTLAPPPTRPDVTPPAWRWPTPTKVEAPAPGVNEPARGFDPVASWFNWRMAQVPDLNKLGQEAMDWDIRTQNEPQGPESEKLRASMEGGGPIGLGAPGGFAGILRNPLTKTKVKYEHPVTGEEPTKVFHGTPHVFEDFKVDAMSKGGLKGPGIYFTENPEMTTGYAFQGMDDAVRSGAQSVGYFRQSLAERTKALEELRARHAANPIPMDREWTSYDFQEFGRRKADEGYAKLEVDVARDLLKEREAEFQRTFAAHTGEGQPNVRPAHLDIRKPFDADTDTLDPRQLLNIAKKLQAGPRGDSAMDMVVRKLQRRLGQSDPYDPRGWQYTKSPTSGVTWADLDDWLGGPETTRFLQRLGYDGITHMGGAVSGGEPHRVWIAFKPEQVISPFEYAKSNPLTPPKTQPSPATQAQKVRQ